MLPNSEDFEMHSNVQEETKYKLQILQMLCYASAKNILVQKFTSR